jgi:hypothetical protein
MTGYAHACGYTVHWFKNLDAAAAARQKDLDRMIAGEYPPNCVGPLERCTAAEAQDWASPHTPSGDWRPSLVIRRIPVAD